MKNIFALLFFLISYSSIAQTFGKKIYGMTLKEIELEIFRDDSKYFIDDLINNFYESDSTFTKKELIYLYYGFTLIPTYKPYVWLSMENEIIRRNHEMQYLKAKTLADSLVGLAPISIMATEELSFSMGRTGDSIGAAFYRDKYEQLLSVLLNSGDGLSKETAWICVTLKDIEVITSVRRMQVTDRQKVKKGDYWYEKVTAFHQYEQKTFWFDITLIETYGKADIKEEPKKKKKKKKKD